MNLISISRITVTLAICLMLVINTDGQTNYRYAVNLNNVTEDQLTIDLLTPKIVKQDITFYFPKIVPGTYMNSNYGKYFHDLKAYDAKGNELPVKKSGDNSWEIKKAKKLYRLSYKVEDTWDSEIKNYVYSMCGTNFEAGKNFVINTPGLFGYFDGMKKMPFDLTFTKPLNFYAATGLKPVSTSATSDNFLCANVDELYDSPIMYSLPDTTTIKVGNSDVLVAIYSPKKLATSKFIAAHLTQLLMGAKDYLGGKLPVDKYAFIFYLNEDNQKLSSAGAWEHSYSSFYSLQGEPQEKAIDKWVDISSHEFFHIVTPLTISSKQVKEFNFQETNLSRHVWLYEGSTEYAAHHMQVKAGITSPEKFLETLATKINNSRSYLNDSLSFTELSTESAGKWKEQYVNVYMKGALISACLDLYLLQLSGGRYSMQDLKHDLGVKYGKDKYFEDEVLFEEIGKLTYPEIKEFLVTYVEGKIPIPYEKYFAMAGVQYIPKEIAKTFSLGGIEITTKEDNSVVISTRSMNDFGKKMGYRDGDELISLNGLKFTKGNTDEVLSRFRASAKEGESVEMVVKRKATNGEYNMVTLSAPTVKTEKINLHVLRFDNAATPGKIKIRNAWLESKLPAKYIGEGGK